MAILTVRLSDKLKRQMRKLRHVNWSQVARRAIEERIAVERVKAGRDAAAISEASRTMDEMYEGVRARHGLVKYDSARTIREWREARYSSSSQTHP